MALDFHPAQALHLWEPCGLWVHPYGVQSTPSQEGFSQESYGIRGQTLHTRHSKTLSLFLKASLRPQRKPAADLVRETGWEGESTCRRVSDHRWGGQDTRGSGPRARAPPQGPRSQAPTCSSRFCRGLVPPHLQSADPLRRARQPCVQVRCPPGAHPGLLPFRLPRASTAGNTL